MPVENEKGQRPTAPAGTPPLNTTTPSGGSPHTSLEIDKSYPQDFDDEISTSSELPSPKLLRKIENYVVLDRHGKTHTFKTLYSGRNVARRVLLIFVRHFFCGNCQEYLRSLSESITPDALLRLPVSTFIAVIGCGDPALIDMYTSETGCPFPIYTDPTRSLYETLGMTKTLALGTKPAYMRRSMGKSIFDSVVQGVKQIPSGKAFKHGDQRQVGGEFLFEPLDMVTPISSPQDERPNAVETFKGSNSGKYPDDEEGPTEEKRITWCHRMKTTRDHAEIPELMEILGLDGNGQPVKDEKRWSKALETRKGVGLTMASQMNQLNEANMGGTA